MKGIISKLQLLSDVFFLYKELERDYFNDPWHFHKEYELLLINKSGGTKFIGDNVSHFEEGDLSLIGSNIPHLLRNSEEFNTKKKKLGVSVTYILFAKDFLGNHFFDIPEMKLVQRLLEKSSLALDIY